MSKIWTFLVKTDVNGEPIETQDRIPSNSSEETPSIGTQSIVNFPAVFNGSFIKMSWGVSWIRLETVFSIVFHRILLEACRFANSSMFPSMEHNSIPRFFLISIRRSDKRFVRRSWRRFASAIRFGRRFIRESSEANLPPICISNSFIRFWNFEANSFSQSACFVKILVRAVSRTAGESTKEKRKVVSSSGESGETGETGESGETGETSEKEKEVGTGGGEGGVSFTGSFTGSFIGGVLIGSLGSFTGGVGVSFKEGSLEGCGMNENFGGFNED